MTKLQAITRKNGTTVYFAYFPKEVIEMVGMIKGDELMIECNNEGTIEVRKE